MAELQIEEMMPAGANPGLHWQCYLIKKNGNLSFSVDYQLLNVFTKKDSHPLPFINDALDYIG